MLEVCNVLPIGRLARSSTLSKFALPFLIPRQYTCSIGQQDALEGVRTHLHEESLLSIKYSSKGMTYDNVNYEKSSFEGCIETTEAPSGSPDWITIAICVCSVLVIVLIVVIVIVVVKSKGKKQLPKQDPEAPKETSEEAPKEAPKEDPEVPKESN